MQKMQFSIEIEAPRGKVWQTLWEDKTLRDWGNIIDEGLYMVGEMAEGNEVQFISPSGNGVTSKILKFIPNELMSFQHMTDTLDGGERRRYYFDC